LKFCIRKYKRKLLEIATRQYFKIEFEKTITPLIEITNKLSLHYKNAKTELARDGLKIIETRPNGKINRKTRQKRKMRLRMDFCRIRNLVIIFNLLDKVNDNTFLTVD